ncbi:trypsin-like peptidase domain-containing protein [Pseudooceanicola aestuarii]|uniref:trypsin-like peptidase domain-containing protein n=1 Tax=Pseudooceanicola aestuarii TaxID=2697319 RepID=UPI0013D2E23E|nr:trypsin-like peptidase domain-containing protein [Pseudooceanicola aestuarii]
MQRPILTALAAVTVTAIVSFSAYLLVPSSAPEAAETRVPVSQAEISLGFAPLVRQAAPAVVNIYAKRVVETRRSPFADDPFFRDFFREFGPSQPRVQNSLGSGVILSEDGIVVSNYHVVAQADEIRVVLNDRREFDATVLLSDAEADLAVLRLDGATDMPHLRLRDSDSVEVGELALAIGNPFGVGQTVSSGIVSGLARTGTAIGNARGYYIQTDAPINPGNSGGALIDINGDLIGVNTRILSKSGGSNGIGFAIPAALVAQFVEQAQAGGARFERPWAGMTGQPVDVDIAATLGLDRPQGLVIADLHEASPFGAAGFRAGDVILAVDGQPVAGPAEMLFRMSVRGLGEEMQVTRYRDGDRKDIAVTLIAPPEDPPRAERQTGRRSALPGLTLHSVNPAVIAEYQLPLTARGALVADPGPVGRRAGLRIGDVLLAVNGKPVIGSEGADRLLRDLRGYLELDVLRAGQRMTMRFRL